MYFKTKSIKLDVFRMFCSSKFIINSFIYNKRILLNFDTIYRVKKIFYN